MKTNWYRMDNSAMIYPMVITQKKQSLFRLGAALKSPVDPNFLRIGLSTALERYPYFKVELKPGLFRHFLDENLHYPKVEPDEGNLLQILNFKQNRHYLFRLTYFENKVFLDLFHGLCDGTGGMEFLKTILYYYFKAQNILLPRENIITLSSPIKAGETEDPFLRYYKKIRLVEGTKKMAGGSAFCIKSKQFSGEGLGMIQLSADTSKLLALSKSYNCTLTVFLSALAMYLIAMRYGEKSKYPFVAFIPINLRKIFQSDTMGNFTMFAKCAVPAKAERTLENFISEIDAQLKSQMQTDELQTKLSFASLMDKLFFLRYMPLILKGFISRISRDFSLKSKMTMIISNMGKILPEDENIDQFIFNLNCSRNAPLNMGILSYKEKTIISFSRKLIEHKLEMDFARFLTDKGVDVSVSSNLREESGVL